ncbi:M48 family metalloprotease [Flavisolibacter tropicus]|uniref:Peptidase M48 Ste24p n=1 Tax=Flavisolibacter tropicus TaxID=1492898 RepID=A0A172TTH3_9BACT|nr:M48 family metalloprotease [Flavisolibacter tropicus]ANE50389.1 peptidase M48 Ste24p [Flavisolibacter tropicus]
MIAGKRLFLYSSIQFLLSLHTTIGKAQAPNPYNYQDLSHTVNIRLRDSLKSKWTVPDIYKNKETQKKYKEFWDGRTAFIVNGIDNKNFIQEKEVYNFVDGIVDKLHKGNQKYLPKKPTLLIDRSAAVNAYSIGGGIIAVNLGLLAFASSQEEVALVIAHELSHDILGHADKSMKERAEWLTSDEYKKSLNEVLDSKYERYSRLKKLMEGYTFSRTRHNRYSESDADSLAVVLLKNSNIAFDAKYFLRLDSADLQYLQPLNKPVKEYFTVFNLPFEDSWTQKRTKGLSSKNYNFKKSNELADSLKTHPDCVHRYENTKAFTTANYTPLPIPATLVKKVNQMIIWNTFDNRNLTACLYRTFQEMDKGDTDAWYKFMVFNIFSGLAFSDAQLERFNSINVTSKEYISQSYYELQTMLEQIPREMLEQYYKNLTEQAFWQQLPTDARNLKSFFYTILNKEATDKSKEVAAKSFTANHATSMYCEFADHFIKK